MKNEQVSFINSSVFEVIKGYKYPLLITFVGMILIMGGLLAPHFQPQSNSPIILSTPNAQSSFAPQGEMKIDVSGAVQNPSVYILHDGDRVEDAIKAAGGFNVNVDSVYVSKSVNLSQKVTDGQKVYIPFKGDLYTSITSDTQSSSNIININNASESELDSLPGIGPVTAQKVIASRPYSTINDLLSKKVVGQSEFEKIKNSISIN